MNTKALIAQLESQLELLNVIVDGPDDALVEARPQGKWSARENLAHVARHQEVFLGRVAAILENDAPRFEAYSAESDAEWPAWQHLAVAEVRDRLLRDRARLLAVVRSLNPTQFQRTATHPVLGSMTLEEWLAFFVLHASHHLLVAMKRARGGT